MPAPSFRDIGFECNPFRALTREEWIAAAVIPESVRRLVQAGGHVQILGETGAGKTTALLALEDEFRRGGRSCAYENIPPKANRFHTKLIGLDVFLLDEAQRLSRGFLFFGNERGRLIRAAKKGVRLILGSHEDLTEIFRAATLILRTVRLEPPGAERLSEILERRLSLFACQADRAGFSEESVEWLRGKFSGDLRTMEFFLYDYFQVERPAGIIRAEPLREALPAFTPPAVEPE